MSVIMQPARNMRRRCHLRSLGAPDSKMTGCPDLPEALCHLLLSKASLLRWTPKQPLAVHEKYGDYSSGARCATRGHLMKRRKGTEAVMQFLVIGPKLE